jgi:hypothetical protein
MSHDSDQSTARLLAPILIDATSCAESAESEAGCWWHFSNPIPLKVVRGWWMEKSNKTSCGVEGIRNDRNRESLRDERRRKIYP